jgi:galactonate dehydratase
LAGAGGLLALDAAFTAERTSAAAVGPNDNIKISRIETFVLKNSWVFVKISTDAGIVGWGEMLKDDAKACAAGAQEAGRFLVGQDPNRVVYLWQQIQRGGFYRGGPVKTAVQSGIDQALWDIKGKVYGVPVYKLLGGPTRDRIRVYGTVSDKTGVNAMKIQPRGLNRGALNSHPSLRTTRKGPVPWPPATRLPRRFRTSSSRSGAITTTKTFSQNRCRRSKKDSARC